MKKEHAAHNEKTCDYLLQAGEYNDWVVTTAFYAAMQYLHHEIFPLNLNNMIYENFNAYYDSVCNNMKHVISDRQSKHQITIDLVHKRLPNCNRFYRWLHHESSNARYANYKVSEQMALTARNYLNFIKNHLKK